jgi:2'-5' RNA ligase
VRTFLAIPLPEARRRAAAEAGRGLGLEPRDWRFVPEDGLHLTLRFLGEVEPARSKAMEPTWRRAVLGIGPLPLRLGGAGAFPDARRPRVVWLGLTDGTAGGALERLAESLEGAARAAGFPPEPRPFFPHVTLARVRRPGRIAPCSCEAVGELGAFVADRVVLFRSELARGGARYVEEASFPLGAEGSP